MVNLEVVTQHAEDAAFLWFSRDRAVRAPHYRLKDLARLDERVEANVDGLRVAKETGWKLAAEATKQEAPGELFAAGALAFESRNQERIDSVITLATKAPSLSRAVVSALGWISFDDAKPALDALLDSPGPESRRIAIAGYAVHRKNPPVEKLAEEVSDANPSLQARACKAAAELGRVDLAYSVVRAIHSRDDVVRFYSAFAAARLGLRDRDVMDGLRAIANAGGPYSQASLLPLRCQRLDESHTWVSEILKGPRRKRLGVIGIGVLGDPARVSELIAYMQIEQLSRVAGESFSMITGADLKYLDLDRPKPEDFEAGPTEDPNDANIAMDEDEDLPWPVPDRVHNWWDKHHHEFQPGIRYLAGKPIEPAALVDILKNAYQRQRAAAALELALLRPSEPMFEVRASGHRQIEALGQWNL